MPAYTYRCANCEHRVTRHQPISLYDPFDPPICTNCSVRGDVTEMVRDYRTDSPQPAPIWPEHFNPSAGQVVRTRTQLADAFARNDEELFERTGIEQRTVVIDRADMTPPEATSPEPVATPPA